MKWRGLFTFTRWRFSKIICHEDKSKLFKKLCCTLKFYLSYVTNESWQQKMLFLFLSEQHEGFRAQNSQLIREKKTLTGGKHSVSRAWNISSETLNPRMLLLCIFKPKTLSLQKNRIRKRNVSKSYVPFNFRKKENWNFILKIFKIQRKITTSSWIFFARGNVHIFFGGNLKNETYLILCQESCEGKLCANWSKISRQKSKIFITSF